MAKYYYDEHTDTLYVTNNPSNDASGWGWFAFFLILATPIFMIGVCVWKAATFIFAHPFISACAYLALSIALALVFYGRKKIKHKFLAILAVIVSLIPIAIIQVGYALPEMIDASGNMTDLSAVIGWIFITFFSVGICVFLNLICRLLKNGIKHLIASTLYLLIVIGLFIVF